MKKPNFWRHCRLSLAALLVAALCAPQAAFAARDGEGMEYTSAAEGFYGSIRTFYSDNTGAKDNGGKIAADGSRLGVRGSLDLGDGLSGLYRYEWSVSGDNGAAVGNTRLSYVGLRGGFGEFVAGSHWENDYNWVTAATDIASTGSGNFAPHFRRKNSFQYTTPDFGGFRASFRFGMDGAAEAASGADSIMTTLNISPNIAGSATTLAVDIDGFGAGLIDTMAPVADSGLPAALTNLDRPLTLNFAANGERTGSETIDEWALAARYATQGFIFGAAYEVIPNRRGHSSPAFALNSLNSMMVGERTLPEAIDAEVDRARRAACVRSTPAMPMDCTNPTVTPESILSFDTTRTLTPIDEDHTFWAIRAGYNHSNWGVNTWYGRHNTGERGTDIADINDAASFRAASVRGFQPQDTAIFSVAGNVDLGKFAVIAIYEQIENEWAMEDNVIIGNIDYKFTSRSKIYFAYIANDFQTAPMKDDEVRLGLRMDF